MAQLKKDGTEKEICCYNRKKGKKSEVYPFKIEDMKKIIDYFANNEMWLYYLLFVLSLNLARRIGDMLSLKWENFFNPKTGNFRNDILEIQEEKTDKFTNPRINSSCRNAINLYIMKTGCDVSKHEYTMPVFLQLTGNYEGEVLSDSGYLKALKKAAAAVGVEYNVGTHSSRKTFGKMSRVLHPGDDNSIPLLQKIFNHRDPNTTMRYIGLTKEKIDEYYDDMGNFFDEYIINGKKYAVANESPIVSLDSNDLRKIVLAAYEAGKNNSDKVEPMIHANAIAGIMKMIEELQK